MYSLHPIKPNYLMNLLVFGFVAFMGFSFTNPLSTTASLEGGWQQVVADNESKSIHVLLFSGNYFSWTAYEAEGGAFLFTKGGSWKKNGNQISVKYEFNLVDSTLVRATENWAFRQKGNQLQLKQAGADGAWTRISAAADSPLAGPWLFSGRKRDGEIQRVDMTTRPRKTMKILTNNRFQWIAYNTETGKFHGTGGGTYTAENGVYTENIEFFSRDNNRVGAALEFKFEIIDGDWHHSGNNSKGQPMYEMWSRRK